MREEPNERTGVARGALILATLAGPALQAVAPAQEGLAYDVSLLPLVDGQSLPTGPGRAFAAVSADLEGDGDLDLLINRHHLAPLELWRNEGGAFRWLNAAGADRSGLFENRGIPFLYHDKATHIAEIEAEGEPGFYIWHDPDRSEAWRFYVWTVPGLGPTVIDFEANWDIVDIRGLEAAEYAASGPRSIVVTLDDKPAQRDFAIEVRGSATQALVRLRQPTLDTFVGLERTLVTDELVELWKPDPHGLVWVHARGTPQPELFVTRGARQGNLVPPLGPKPERFYEYAPTRAGLYQMADEGVIRRSYTRSRQAEWVDVDGDGTNELYVASRESVNRLLRLDASGASYTNEAEQRGLDLFHGDTFAWLDLDDDGDEDLVYLDGNDLSGLRNQQGDFSPLDVAALGLSLSAEPGGDLFDRLRLQPADFDNDGRLDVLASGVGEALGLQLFLRRGTRFVDVSAAAGLADVEGAHLAVLLDADNDSFLDLWVAGEELELWRNERGGAFSLALSDVDLAMSSGPFDAATVTDVDTDGRQDVLLVKGGPVRRLVARNATENPNAFLRVALDPGNREQIGAVVRAHYKNGTVRAQRYGSADNSAFSQALARLHFGIPQGTRIETLSVRWPGRARTVSYPVPDPAIGATIVLKP